MVVLEHPLQPADLRSCVLYRAFEGSVPDASRVSAPFVPGEDMMLSATPSIPTAEHHGVQFKVNTRSSRRCGLDLTTGESLSISARRHDGGAS